MYGVPVGRSGASAEDGVENVIAHGADRTGTTDSYAAFVRARAAMSPGKTFLVPHGEEALSQKFTYDKFRTVFDCQGKLMPFGTYSDFLIDFNAPGADPEYLNLALQIDVRRLEVDGRHQSRGVRFDQLYLSSPQNVILFNCLGTALAIDNSMECGWYGLVIANGKRREATWKAGATVWSNVTAYTVGQYVRVDYVAYGAGTAYVANNFVTYSGRAYRALTASTGFQPDLSGSRTRWQPVPYEYFECMIAHTGRDPHSASNYTTNSPVTGDKYWKQVYADEASLEVVNTYGTEVVDNQKFFAAMWRHNDHETLIRIDNLANERKVVNIEFYGCQVHHLIEPMITAFPAVGWVRPDYTQIVQIGYGQRCKFFGGTTRTSESIGATHFQIGMKNPAKISYNHIITGLDISGEGEANYGLSLMPSGSSTGLLVASNNEYSFANSATSPRICGDTTRLTSSRGAHDIVTATTPANFTATHAIREADASGSIYFRPVRTALW